MSLRDRIVAVLAKARAEGGDVISIAAVEGVIARWSAEQHQAKALPETRIVPAEQKEER